MNLGDLLIIDEQVGAISKISKTHVTVLFPDGVTRKYTREYIKYKAVLTEEVKDDLQK